MDDIQIKPLEDFEDDLLLINQKGIKRDKGIKNCASQRAQERVPESAKACPTERIKWRSDGRRQKRTGSSTKFCEFEWPWMVRVPKTHACVIVACGLLTEAALRRRSNGIRLSPGFREAVGLSRSGQRKALLQLEEAGLIRRHTDGKKSTEVDLLSVTLGQEDSEDWFSAFHQ